MATAGEAALYSLGVTNSGTRPERFALSATDLAGTDDGDFTAIHLFLDQNRDLVADDGQEISNTGEMESGAEIGLLAIARVPVDAVGGTARKFEVAVSGESAGGATASEEMTAETPVSAITLAATHGVDADCDGDLTGDGDVDFTDGAVVVKPNGCLVYRLEVDNADPVAGARIEVASRTPEATRLEDCASACRAAVVDGAGAPVAIAAPALPEIGGSGAIGFDLGQLAGGESRIVSFAVRVEALTLSQTLAFEAALVAVNAADAKFRAAVGPLTARVPEHSAVKLVDALMATHPEQGAVRLALAIENTGNVDDVFALSAANTAGDDEEFEFWRLFLDVDGDGVADDPLGPELERIALAVGARVQFVVTAAYPAETRSGSRLALAVSAEGQRGVRATTTAGVTVPVHSMVAVDGDVRAIGQPEEDVSFVLVASNAGNVADSFDITLVESAGDDGNYAPRSLTVFADANRDGAPDDTTPIASLPALDPGEAAGFVVQGTIPANARGEDRIEAELVVRSRTDTGQFVRQTLTATVGATFTVTGGDEISGVAGSTAYIPYRVINWSGAPIAIQVEVRDRAGDDGDFDAGGLRVANDANGDGLADRAGAGARMLIEHVRAGAEIGFVIEAAVPSTASSGDRLELEVRVSSAPRGGSLANRRETSDRTAVVVAGGSGLSLTAMQGVDENCDGDLLDSDDVALTSAEINPEARRCVVYRLELTTGTQAATDVSLVAPTPRFTNLHQCSQNACKWTLTDGAGTTVAADSAAVPNDGAKGQLRFALGDLPAQTTRILQFAVKLEWISDSGFWDQYPLGLGDAELTSRGTIGFGLIGTATHLDAASNPTPVHSNPVSGGFKAGTGASLNVEHGGIAAPGEREEIEFVLENRGSRAEGFSFTATQKSDDSGDFEELGLFVETGTGRRPLAPSDRVSLNPGQRATLWVVGRIPRDAVDGGTIGVVLSGRIAGTTEKFAGGFSVLVQTPGVSVLLAQAADAECDGKPDHAFRDSKSRVPVLVGPGECLAYQVRIESTSHAMPRGVMVEFETPESTRTPPSLRAIPTRYTTCDGACGWTVRDATGDPVALAAEQVSAPSPGASGTLRFALGDLEPGAVRTIGVTLQVDPGEGDSWPPTETFSMTAAATHIDARGQRITEVQSGNPNINAHIRPLFGVDLSEVAHYPATSDGELFARWRFHNTGSPRGAYVDYPSRYMISAVNLPGDDGDLVDLALYDYFDSDGWPDSDPNARTVHTDLTTLGGFSDDFVVGGTLPEGAMPGDEFNVLLSVQGPASTSARAVIVALVVHEAAVGRRVAGTSGAPDTFTDALDIEAEAGELLTIRYEVENRGNVADRFDLSFEQAGDDAGALIGPAIFADADEDGEPDSTTPITSTGMLQPGEAVHLVATATAPSVLAASAEAPSDVTLTLVATSAGDATKRAQYRVTATISEYKAELVAGAAPDIAGAGETVIVPYRVTNAGNVDTEFDLTAVQPTTDSGDLENLELYDFWDPDNPRPPLAKTPSLAPGAAFDFAVVGAVPGDAAPGARFSISVSAAASDAEVGRPTIDEFAIVVSDYGISLATDGAGLGAPGATVAIPYRLESTGNQDNRVSLSAINQDGDDGRLSDLLILADADADGHADDPAGPALTLVDLPAGATSAFVVLARIPDTAATGDAFRLRVIARASMAAGCDPW